MATQRTLRIRVEGRVQGVGFRVFVEREAIKRSIRGYVRNRRDGGVEVLATGDVGQLNDFIIHIRKGPRAGRVDIINVSDDDERASDGFIIASTV